MAAETRVKPTQGRRGDSIPPSVSRSMAALSPREIGRALERRLLAIFAISSLVAIIAGLVFFSAGLDFTPHQRRLVYFAIAPIATIFMVIVEVTAVRRLVRPIRTFLDSYG